MSNTPAIDDWTFEQQLREMNEALLVSSVRQHELAEQAHLAEVAHAATNDQLATELAATRRLQEMSSRLIEAGDSAGLYEHIVQAAADNMHSEMSSMQILDTDRGALRMLVHHGFDPAFGKAFEWVGSDSNTSCGMALRHGSRVIVPDVKTFQGVAGTPTCEAQLAVGIRATQSTPLFSRIGCVLGMITTHWRLPHEPPESDLRRLDILARQAADLIERALSEATLRASELRYRRLFESAKDGIVILDAETGKITDANAFLCGLLEVEARELRGKELHEMGLFKDKSASRAAVRKLQEQGYIRYENLSLETKRGQVEVEVIANVYQIEQQSVIQCNIRDITDRRRLEKLAQEQTVALADLHRRKDEFLAMLGHELRSPLAPITNALHLLRLQKGEDQVQRQARTIIERQVGQLTRLVDDLLEISRISTGRIHLHQERVALNGIVENAIETACPLIGLHKHSLEASLSPQPIWLYADAARLEQVVVNLLTNAAKYTANGGQIWLSIQQEGDEGVLRVRDSGFGIAPELLPHIFDLFTQAEKSLARSDGGLGIGLSLVQRLVEMHRGRVEVYSVLGQGSEFVVRLPVVLTPAPLPTPTIVKAAIPAGPSLRVLVVDDNKDAAQTLAMLLTVTGHQVRTAHDGLAALEVALDYRPQVVLLDIGLPGLDGYEVAKRMRQQAIFKDVILVAMTGYGQEADRQRSHARGSTTTWSSRSTSRRCKKFWKPSPWRRCEKTLCWITGGPHSFGRASLAFSVTPGSPGWMGPRSRPPGWRYRPEVSPLPATAQSLPAGSQQSPGAIQTLLGRSSPGAGHCHTAGRRGPSSRGRRRNRGTGGLPPPGGPTAPRRGRRPDPSETPGSLTSRDHRRRGDARDWGVRPRRSGTPRLQRSRPRRSSSSTARSLRRTGTAGSGWRLPQRGA